MAHRVSQHVQEWVHQPVYHELHPERCGKWRCARFRGGTSAAINEVGASIEDVAAMSESMSSSVEEVATSIEETTRLVSGISENAATITDTTHAVSSADVLFQSAAEVYESRVLGVVMTGMGNDGTQGAAWIKAKGGLVYVESEETSVIYGMPRSVVEAGGLMARIMIVDDSALSRRMLRSILESAVYEVIEAVDGISALELYFLEKPDVVPWI